MLLVQRKDNSLTPLLKWTSCQPFGVFSLLEGKNVYLFKISHSISCLGVKQNALQLRSPELEPGRFLTEIPSVPLQWLDGTTNVSLVHEASFFKKQSSLGILDGSLQSCQTHFAWSLFRRLQYLSTTVLKDPSRNNSDSSILASLDDDFGSFTWTTWARPTQESFRFEKPKKKPLWKTPAWYKITSELLDILSK